MTKEENRSYVRKAESLLKPRDTTAISFLGDFNKFLPMTIQQRMVRSGSAKVPYMGFIVEPWCCFLSFRITDRSAAQALLPDGCDLADVAVFRNDAREPRVIISAFCARTSAFTGMRLECYVIARSRTTGLVSWIIVDYLTNTSSHDPRNGFCGYTAAPAIHTTTPYGELLVQVAGSGRPGEFGARVDLNAGTVEDLDTELWVEGNMSVDYGGALKSESSAPFSLVFDPALMEKALRIPPDKVAIEASTLLERIIVPSQPECVAVFPYSQHFVIRQSPGDRRVTRAEDLFEEIRAFMGRDRLKTMSRDDLKRPLLRGMLVSLALNLGIMIFLLVKALS